MGSHRITWFNKVYENAVALRKARGGRWGQVEPTHTVPKEQVERVSRGA